jgi:rare lipoprotein A
LTRSSPCHSLRAALAASLFGLILIGGAQLPASIPEAAAAPSLKQQVGKASWYGPGFHGRRTASGERFNQNALTAAHPSLHLPSLVRVTNVENGRTVVVRVNDRGPYRRGRIIDVSRGAARQLGFLQKGTARVRLEVLREGGA